MEHILILGSGSMGGGMASLFAEKGSSVSLFDKDAKAVDAIIETTQSNDKIKKDQVRGFTDMKEFMNSSPKDQAHRIIVLSLPHGSVVDKLIDEMEGFFDKGDIVLDCGNEWYQNTERRQQRCSKASFGKGAIHWMGVGVSGGYQAARRGPSFSPGGDKEIYDKVAHLLNSWAVKDKHGNPCAQYIGPRGAGHHVKCLHNGIEQAELSAICEVYTLLRHTLDLSNDECGDIFEKWGDKGGLSGNFLIQIGSQITHFKQGDGIQNNKGIVDDIEDKVTQDADDSEGTGVWSIWEAATRHVAAPSIATAHFLRLVSANRGEREQVIKHMNLPQPSKAPANLNKEEFINKLHDALHVSILAAFVQGLNVISRASKDEKWDVSLERCIQIWRAGCIIQSDGIADLLEPVFHQEPHLINVLLDKSVSQEAAKSYSALKDVVALAIQVDAVVPALSSTLEYLKSVAGKSLPTSFEETEMDYFGHHNYDLKSEHAMEPKKGAHHTEFKPA